MESKLFSIVIPAFNEEKYIAKCLDSILAQHYPAVEAVVVNGMSTDATADIVSEYAAKHPNIRMVENPQRITPVSLNLGIRAAKGEMVAILGAHSYLDPDFVGNNVRNITEKNVACSGGIIKTISEDELSKSIALAMSSPFGVGNALFRYAEQEAYVDTVAFGAYRKEIFDQIGYFDEQLVRNQDDELNFRLALRGEKILLSPDIISYYYSRGNFKKLWKQYYQYGFWKMCVIRKHHRPASLRHLVPSAFVLSLVFWAVMGAFFPICWQAGLVELAVYILAGALVAGRISLREGWRHFFRLMLCFPILHLSYGIGFIFGFFAFVIFRKNNRKFLDRNSQISR